MFTDKLLELSAAQAVTATAVSTSSVDLQVARDIGEGDRLYVDFRVSTTATAAGAATVAFEIVTADDAALTTNVTVLQQSAPVAVASLVAGYRTALVIPPQIGSVGRRYIGAQFVVATGPLTAGNFDARIVKDIEDGLKPAYASGFSVS